ncbi:hypothetical protein P3T22_002269 [Paraburkholderia sp. GAS348]
MCSQSPRRTLRIRRIDIQVVIGSCFDSYRLGPVLPNRRPATEPTLVTSEPLLRQSHPSHRCHRSRQRERVLGQSGTHRFRCVQDEQRANSDCIRSTSAASTSRTQQQANDGSVFSRSSARHELYSQKNVSTLQRGERRGKKEIAPRIQSSEDSFSSHPSQSATALLDWSVEHNEPLDLRDSFIPKRQFEPNDIHLINRMANDLPDGQARFFRQRGS